MEITKDVYDAHRRLSQCSVQFLDFVKKNPEGMKRANFKSIISEHRFTIYHPLPWPTFMNQETKEEMKEATLKVFNLIKVIPRRLFENDPRKISHYYNIPEDECNWMLYNSDDDQLDCLLSRGDFSYSPTAGLKCLEFNIHASLGGWELELLEEHYLKTPIISKFLTENHIRLRHNSFIAVLMDHIRDDSRKRFGPNTDEINIAMAFPDYKTNDPIIYERFDILTEKIHRWQKENKMKGEIIPCDLEQLEMKNGFLMYKDRQIHVLLESYTGNIPMLILDAVKKKKLLIYNGPISLILSHKLNIALLSEYRNSNLFSPEEKEVINKYIPWTRKVIPGFTTYGKKRIRLEKYIISNREQLVLKAGNTFGGIGVAVGYATPPEKWQKLLQQALEEKDWVVQEYIKSYPYCYQYGEDGYAIQSAVWGFFIFKNRYAGGFIRVLPEKGNPGVINAKQGAELGAILEVEE